MGKAPKGLGNGIHISGEYKIIVRTPKKGNYKLALANFKQDLEQQKKKTIRSIFFTAAQPRPQGASTIDTTGDKTTWECRWRRPLHRDPRSSATTT